MMLDFFFIMGKQRNIIQKKSLTNFLIRNNKIKNLKTTPKINENDYFKRIISVKFYHGLK